MKYEHLQHADSLAHTKEKNGLIKLEYQRELTI